MNTNGNLIRTPLSEINATLEMLAALGVTSQHLAMLRGESNKDQVQFIAHALQRDPRIVQVSKALASERILLIQMFLAGKISFVKPTFGIWKTCQVFYNGSAGHVSRIAGSSAGIIGDKSLTYEIGRDTMALFRQYMEPIDKKPEKVSFVKLSARSLGYVERPHPNILFDEKQLASVGLGLCDVHEVMALRCDYRKQPEGPRELIACKPMILKGDPQGERRMFDFQKCNTGLYIEDWIVSKDEFCFGNLDLEYIFRLV